MNNYEYRFRIEDDRLLNQILLSFEPLDEDVGFFSENDKLETWLKELGCYKDEIDVIGWQEDDDGVKKYVSIIWYRITNIKLTELLIKYFSTITFKKLEDVIMSNPKAPYKLWSLTALISQVKQRKLTTPKDFKELSDPEKKKVLIDLLISDDKTSAKKPEDKKSGKKSSSKKEVVNEDKKSGKKSSSKKEVVNEDEEIEDIDEDDDDGEEFEDEEIEDIDEDDEDDDEFEDIDTDKEPDDDVEEEVEEEPKKKTPVKTQAKKADKPKAKSNKPNLNDKLKDKGLWKKGMQFLSSNEKQQLLDAKDEKHRKVVYDILEEKNAAIAKKQSKIMKNKAANK